MNSIDPVALEQRAVEQQVAFDMIRRGLPAVPVLVVLAGLPWGVAGSLSAAFAIVLVLGNFALAAVMLSMAARISLAVLMVAALGGYVVRLAVITAAVLLVKDQDWVAMMPLGLTLIIAHLGLLFWETRYVSLSLAFPGLKPSREGL